MQPLDEGSPCAGFDFAHMPLRAYQRAELWQMALMEAEEYSPRPGVDLRTRFGVLGTKVGAGKTVTLCALIKSTEAVDPRERLPRHSTVGTSALVVRRAIHTPGHTVLSPCSLIIVPHGLRYQWERELEGAGVAYCTHADFQPGAAACLVTATKLAGFIAENSHVHFKRLILDEADTITIRNQPLVQTSFTWFVTATYHGLDANWRCTFAKPIFLQCFRYFAATGLSLEDMVVRSRDEWVDHCNQLPPVQANTVVCAMPAYMNVMAGPSLSASIAEMLAAGDVEGAILAMGGDAESEHNVVDVMTARIAEDVRRLEARANYLASVGSTSAAAAAREAARSKQEQLASIRTRLAKLAEGTCAICLADLAEAGSHVVTGCCSHLFCAPCLMTWRCRVNTCPMCRAPGSAFTLIRSAAEGAAAPPAAADRPKTKEQALMEIISGKPDGKFIVFSSHDRTFDALQTLMSQHGISSRVLKGPPAAFRKILTDHQQGRTKVLLMNSRFDGAGHSMQWVTDAITYHRLGQEAMAQVTGRGMRPGRTAPLCMHHLRWPCEV